jgi:hypothetical protein
MKNISNFGTLTYGEYKRVYMDLNNCRREIKRLKLKNIQMWEAWKAQKNKYLREIKIELRKKINEM